MLLICGPTLTTEDMFYQPVPVTDISRPLGEAEQIQTSPSGKIIQIKTGNLFVVHSVQLDKNYSEAEYDAHTIQ